MVVNRNYRTGGSLAEILACRQMILEQNRDREGLHKSEAYTVYLLFCTNVTTEDYSCALLVTKKLKSYICLIRNRV